MKLLPAILLATTLPFTGPAQEPAAGKAQHVVMIVWDGMRPDFVTDEYTPTLAKMARKGVTFARHHSVYITSTEVNGAALATGVYPNRSGIMANREYRPEINAFKPVDTQSTTTIRLGDELAHGRYIGVPTIAEILQNAGHPTVIAGTKPVALLHDRSAKRDVGAASQSVTLFGGTTLPPAALEPIAAALGPFPPPGKFPNANEDAWTTGALLDSLWKGGVPKFSVLWMSEPDFSQHEAAPGSATALAALKSDDRNLARVLDALDAKGLREKTDVLVVSDHGFSTIARQIDVAKTLVQAGFKAARVFTKKPEPGEIMVVTNGGSTSLYVTGHDAEVVRKLVEFLQGSDFAGVIVTREPLPGTFTLEQLRLNTRDAPDIVVSLRWTAEKSKLGVRGMLTSDLGKKAGQGAHASLSPFEIHNTCIAAGPDFREGWKDELPTANVDLAPTILSLLGVKAPQPMDGRVLREALAGESAPAIQPEQQRIEASRQSGTTTWRQYLKFTKLGDATYLDEGGSSQMAK